PPVKHQQPGLKTLTTITANRPPNPPPTAANNELPPTQTHTPNDNTEGEHLHNATIRSRAQRTQPRTAPSRTQWKPAGAA
ncbi:hypothetical protein, partial [Klebsiella pneumoniae]|uniref:hypothetical protein n=1 Tax=Klebsiella pneumoniae TaxID=573 RepID=UPI00273180D7